MSGEKVLIADDEKNIRLTLKQCLKTMDLSLSTAVNGEDALVKIEKDDYHIVLLDLKLPGMSGMDVLRWISINRPDIKVIIITAHGTVDTAVEAMKLGAVDFIEKPFAPVEIRTIVEQVLHREQLHDVQADDYTAHINLAKRCITERHHDAAIEHVHHAIGIDPSKPEAFNLLGNLMEIKGNIDSARKNYRAAVSLDPTYHPAKQNLQRLKYRPNGDIQLMRASSKED